MPVEVYFMSKHVDKRSSVILLRQGFLLIVQTTTPPDLVYGLPEKVADEIYTQNDHELAYARFMEISQADTIKAY